MSKDTRGALEGLVNRLLSVLDVGGGSESAGYVEALATAIDPTEISKLRMTTSYNKLKQRVGVQQTDRFNQLLQDVAGQKSSPADKYLHLIGLIMEDKALTTLLSTANSSGVSSPPSTPSKPNPLPPSFQRPSSTLMPSGSQSQPSSSLLSANAPLSRLPSTSSLGGSLAPGTGASGGASGGLPQSSSFLSSLPALPSLSSSDRPAAVGSDKQLERPPEDEELMELLYGSKIVLRSNTGKYGVLDGDLNFVVDSPNSIAFVIMNSRHPRDRGPVRFQDTILLYNEDGFYLSSESSGVVNGRKSVQDQRLRWNLCPAPCNPGGIDAPLGASDVSTAVGVVKIFDKVALKSCFGTYLTDEGAGVGSAKGKIVSIKETWGLAPANLPFAPEWLRRRLYLLYKGPGKDDAATSSAQQQQISSLSLPVQEQLLIEDLLFAMMGIEGVWIKNNPNAKSKFHFELSPHVRDKSLREVVERILPVCDHYSHVAHYVQVHGRFEYGVVQHAFSAAIRVMLKEYLILVAQLEHQYKQAHTLTLLRLWFYIQPSLRTMERLFRITELAATATGGALLNVVYTTMIKEGEPQTRALYQFLISEAAQPFFTMLEQWIYHGVVNDPYDEFLIYSREDLTKENLMKDFNDTYWDVRYTVRSDKLPVFLEAVAEKILITGKYLNVIRECGRNVDSPVQRKIVFTTNDREFVSIIETAYQFASRELLQLLVVEKQLLARLTSIKRYFLLNQGDFLVHFMDIAEEDLNKPLDQGGSSSGLESLLELALRTSNASNDPFKDDLSCYLGQFTLMQKVIAISAFDKKDGAADDGDDDGPSMGGSAAAQMAAAAKDSNQLKRLDGLTLAYQVRWPLSLIISKKTLTKYQLIFRHLFYCKYVERQLNGAWMNQQIGKELSELRGAFIASYALRHRMLHFIQNFTYYVMVEVLEPNWHELEQKLKTVTTVDEVIKWHNAFLDKCLKECLLTNQQLFKVLRKVMSTCLLFSSNLERFAESCEIPETTQPADDGDKPQVNFRAKKAAKLKAMGSHVNKLVQHVNYVKMIDKFVAHFDEKLRLFVQHLRDKSSTHYDHHLANLYTRLNYNGFYDSYFEYSGPASASAPPS